MARNLREQSWELMLLALTIWREARGEGFHGMCAVAWSIRNRVLKPGKTWWGDDWEEVVLKPWQYTANHPSDPNSKTLPADPEKEQSWAEALEAAERAYFGTGVNPIQDATHYYNPAGVAKTPDWVNAAGSRYVCSVGNHKFYVAA